MERSITSSISELLSSVLSQFTNVFTRRSPKDPDLDQIFSDAIEREMIYRELHCR